MVNKIIKELINGLIKNQLKKVRKKKYRKKWKKEECGRWDLIRGPLDYQHACPLPALQLLADIWMARRYQI